jgi:hypothetical protein
MDDGRRKSSLYRAVNERIREISADWDVAQAAGFFCECADARCSELLSLTVVDYEAIRAMGDCFVVLGGHEPPDCDRILARNNGHVILRAADAAR